MNFNELATIKEQNLPIKIILFNNQCLGMVWQLQDVYCDKNYFAVDMPGNPDFSPFSGSLWNGVLPHRKSI